MRLRHHALVASLGSAVLVIAPAPARATEYVNDPLTSATFAGRGSRGGSFGAGGWTTIDEPDAVWYEIADALPSGSIEYTVTGLSVGGSLSGADHDILTMYQAPTGTTEPIAYSPTFRNNDFKAFTRIFGSMETGRGGAMKFEVAFCPRGEPWYHDEACTAACDGSGLGYAHGSPVDIGWDPATAYRMVLTWGSGKFAFSRNGEELATIPYPGEYAPKPLRVRLGSPRHDGVYPGVAFMPKGLVFKDLKISGTPGARTPVCGTTVPDAGSDTSVTPDSGSTSTTVLGALQDVTGASWESSVFPDVNDLNVEGAAGGAPGAIVYLKFPPISPPPKRVVLKVRSAAAGSAAGGSGEPCLVADDAWSETSLTWSTKPPTGTCAGGVRSIDSDVDVEWDVTALFTTPSTGNRNLAIVSKDTNGAHYLSKEASPTQGPRLLVVPGDPTGDAGVGDSGPKVDAGADASTDAAADAKTGDAKPNDDRDAGDVNGGCGCRTTTRDGSLSGLAALGLSFAMAVSRRRIAHGRRRAR
jgi:hypothetical protein